MVAGFLPCDPSRVARKLGSLSSGDSPKYGSGHQARTSRIVEVVEPTNELASGIQPRQRRVLDVEHPSRGIDLEATEGEGDPAADRIGFERRLFDRVGPVGLVYSKSFGPPTILDVGIERHILPNGGIVFPDRLQEVVKIHILHLIGEFFERIRLDLGGATQLVLVAQQMSQLRVKPLDRKSTSLNSSH